MNATPKTKPTKQALNKDLLHNARTLVRLYDDGEDIKPVIEATRECLRQLKAKARK